ncbi:MFS transporter [Streptosporangium subroseum]|uniref:MFS transporter n=1 Tax=Streptosporangium subroseum TaxID=106412 RepID=UPI003089EBD1|nr:MFS transporter [Streptosporangium subroseum]
MSGPLRERAFLRLWIAGFISEIGDWMLLVALPVFVYQLTGSAAATATTFVVALLPSLLLSPVAGVLADRWDRRLLMLGVSLVQAAALLPLLAVHDAGDLVLINVVMVAHAGLAILFEPAKNALLPTLVKPDQVAAANGLIGLNSNLARLVGASLGGVLLGFSGLAGVLLADVVSFLLAALLLLRPFRAGTVEREHPPVFRAWLEGLREIRDRGPLRVMLGVVGLMAVSQGIFVVLFVVFVTDRLGGGEAEIGVLRGVQAVGGVLGGLLVGVLARRLRAGRLLGLALLVFGLISAIGWNGPYVTMAPAFYLVLFAVIGAPGVIAGAGMMSVLQLHTADETRGRVLGSFFSLNDGFQALGMMLAGVLVVPLGLTVMLNVQAGLYALAGLVALRRWWREKPGNGGHEEGEIQTRAVSEPQPVQEA